MERVAKRLCTTEPLTGDGRHRRWQCRFTRYRNADGTAAHGPAPQHWGVHMLAFRSGVGGHDGRARGVSGTADACGA